VSKRTPKSVKASCDELWAQIIKTRARGRCEHCGVEQTNPFAWQAAHIYGRSNHRLRFDLRNGMGLCAGCHRWAHNYPIELAAWLAEYRPADLAYLRREHAKLVYRDLAAYLALEEELRSELAKLEAALAAAPGVSA